MVPENQAETGDRARKASAALTHAAQTAGRTGGPASAESTTAAEELRTHYHPLPPALLGVLGGKKSNKNKNRYEK